MKTIILAILVASSVSFANRESVSRIDGPGTFRPPPMMPSLRCHLRQPSRGTFALSISASTKSGITNVDIYASGPTDALVKIGHGTGAWSIETGNSVVLTDGRFLVRVFAFNSKSNGPFLATFESELQDVTLLYCSQK